MFRNRNKQPIEKRPSEEVADAMARMDAHHFTGQGMGTYVSPNAGLSEEESARLIGVQQGIRVAAMIELTSHAVKPGSDEARADRIYVLSMPHEPAHPRQVGDLIDSGVVDLDVYDGRVLALPENTRYLVVNNAMLDSIKNSHDAGVPCLSPYSGGTSWSAVSDERDAVVGRSNRGYGYGKTISREHIGFKMAEDGRLIVKIKSEHQDSGAVVYGGREISRSAEDDGTVKRSSRRLGSRALGGFTN
ncbi:MAG: hypothetical protein AAF413_03075 [Patescibacteria group bacterium]